MILTCPSCTTRYKLDPERLGDDGRKVRCSDCGFEWFQPPEVLEEEEDESDDESFFSNGIDDEIEEEIQIDLTEHENDPPVETSQNFEDMVKNAPLQNNNVKGSSAGRLAATVLFICVLSGLWFYKSGIMKIWPETYAVYSALGVQTKTLDINDISFERFEAVQEGAEIVINGMIYNLKSEDLELPPLVMVVKDEAEKVIAQVIFALDEPLISREGTKEIQKVIRLDETAKVKLIELRPATPQENQGFMKESQSMVSSAG